MTPDDKITVLRKIVTGDETLRVTVTGEEFSSDWAVVCKYRGHQIASIVVIENLAPLSAAYAS